MCTIAYRKANRPRKLGGKTTFTALQVAPIFSIIMGIAAAALFFFGKAGGLLQYDRNAIAAGQLWRLLSGHWLHWSLDHLWWCTLVLVLTGGLCEHLCRKGFMASLIAASLIIPTTAWLLMPEMLLYRGLSGLDSTVFVFSAVWLTRTKCDQRDWRGFFLFAVLCMLFLAKLLYEVVTGHAFFAKADGIFTPVPLVHLVGGMVGAVMAFIFWKKEKRVDGCRLPKAGVNIPQP
jgi:rhomboid family GlyGly-CTERM serine protease